MAFQRLDHFTFPPAVGGVPFSVSLTEIDLSLTFLRLMCLKCYLMNPLFASPGPSVKLRTFRDVIDLKDILAQREYWPGGLTCNFWIFFGGGTYNWTVTPPGPFFSVGCIRPVA